LLEPLIIYDPTETYGSEYLICLNGEAKYGYLQAEEDANLALVDSTTAYVYRPPSPEVWLGLFSDQEIERDWVVDSRPKVLESYYLNETGSQSYDFLIYNYN
jgi:hypothetical protein